MNSSPQFSIDGVGLQRKSLVGGGETRLEMTLDESFGNSWDFCRRRKQAVSRRVCTSSGAVLF